MEKRVRKRRSPREIFPRTIYGLYIGTTCYYVGSCSVPLNNRLGKHRKSPTYQFLRDNKDSLSIRYIDQIDNQSELWKEDLYIRTFREMGEPLLNTKKAIFLNYDSNWNTYNKNYHKEYYRTYREEHRAEYNEYHRLYMQKNK